MSTEFYVALVMAPGWWLSGLLLGRYVLPTRWRWPSSPKWRRGRRR